LAHDLATDKTLVCFGKLTDLLTHEALNHSAFESVIFVENTQSSKALIDQSIAACWCVDLRHIGMQQVADDFLPALFASHHAGVLLINAEQQHLLNLKTLPPRWCVLSHLASAEMLIKNLELIYHALISIGASSKTATHTLLQAPTPAPAAESLLEDLNQKLLAALEVANMIYFEWHIKTGERTAIGQQEKVLGIAPDSIDQARLAVHPDDAARDEALVNHSLETGAPYSNQFRLILPDGGYKWLQSSARVIFDEDGKASKLSGLCFDVTERIKMLELQQQSDLELKRAVSIGKLISWEWSKAQGLKIGAGAFEEIIGNTSGEMSAEQFHKLIHPEDVAVYLKALKIACEHKTDYRSEYRIIRPDGKIRWLFSNGSSQFDDEGNVISIVGVAVDITDRKTAELELNDSLRWLNLVVQAAEINTYSIDLLTRARKGGPLDNTMYGKSPATVEELQACIHPDDHAKGNAAITDAIQNKKSYRIRYRVNHPTDGWRWHETMAMPEFNEYDQAVRLSGVAFDIHERIEQTDSLERALQRAEKATKSKAALLASMSHEIRTPMNAVVGVSELLTKSNLNQQQKDWVATLMNSSNQLLDLINEILDYSKLDAGAVKLNLVDFNLHECIESSVSLIASSAAAKGLNLNVFYTPDLYQGVNADITRIRQIIVNLLSNAVKFTESGSVDVSAILKSEDDASVVLELRVKDTGIGMDANTVSRLFLPFTQGDTTFTRRFGGTGLGLSISKQLCELMQGRISLNTELGVGTEFLLRLPLTKAAASDENLVKPSLLENKKIALFVMNHAVQENLKKQLQCWGAEVAIYQDLADLDDTIELIIMPEQTWSRDASNVRSVLEKTPSVMLQLYTTSAEDDHVLSSMNGQILHYPYFPTQLLSAINKSLGVSPSSQPVIESTRLSPELEAIKNLRILIVEDNEINQYVLLAMLESIGCTATIASDGLQAVNEFETRQYDVVLMDIEMPIMDGMQATRAIRKHPQITQPHIIALTAHVMPDSRSKFIASGMNDYVSKPVLMEELIASLSKVKQALHAQ
jgi:PAS domain S-box-containing protein